MLSAQNDKKKNIMTEKRQHVVPTQEVLSWREEPGTRPPRRRSDAQEPLQQRHCRRRMMMLLPVEPEGRRCSSAAPAHSGGWEVAREEGGEGGELRRGCVYRTAARHGRNGKELRVTGARARTAAAAMVRSGCLRLAGGG